VLVGERSSFVVTINRQTLGGRSDPVLFRLSAAAERFGPEPSSAE